MAHKSRVKKIALGADHRGYRLKEKIKKYLIKNGYKVIDFGTDSEDPKDYPDFAIPVAEAVAKRKIDVGILICYTGIGMSIAANKVKGVRAALGFSPTIAGLARKHNNANILCLGSMYTSYQKAKKIIDVWLSTDFEGNRHKRRVKKIKKYENSTISSR